MKTLVVWFALVAALGSTKSFAQDGHTAPASSASPPAQDWPAAPSQAEQLATAIAHVKAGDFGTSEVEVIAKAGAVQAVPTLEAQFARTTDVDVKTKIANGLVRLGDKDDAYWNYLLEQATLAVDSDVPGPDAFFSGPPGKTTDRQFSPELEAWAQAHHVDMNTAMQSALYDLPGKVFELGQTGDKRGVPLLRRALQARDIMIAGFAAMGLAQIQDKDSIAPIIAACGRAPMYASFIAKPLIWFDDPQAQAAVDLYISKEDAKIWRDARAQGMGAFGW